MLLSFGLRHASSAHPNALIGSGCNIGLYVFIDDLAVVGAHCRIEAGAHISRGAVIEDNVLIGANVTFAAAPTGSTAVVKQGVCIGANATILAGLVIGEKAVIRPGAVISRSVPPAAIVEGNPASISGYVDADQGTEWATQSTGVRKKTGVELTQVKGVSLHHFPVIKDMRGDLMASLQTRGLSRPVRLGSKRGLGDRTVRPQPRQDLQ
jgi:UDP-2-acetamido-3-amino-2,3-dideoxy-glucuronate N-acetyltransferase